MSGETYVLAAFFFASHSAHIVILFSLVFP